MNTAASSFTPLESLLLFQAILQYGIDAEAFAKISARLKNNVFVRNDDSYNADRLSSESLQRLFLHLLRDELKHDEHWAQAKGDSGSGGGGGGGGVSAAAGGSGGGSSSGGSAAATPAAAASPGPGKKRKLPSPPLPTFSDIYNHAEQLPALVERLYVRYSNRVIASIREDERRLAVLQAEIRILEKAEQNGAAEEASKTPSTTAAAAARTATPAQIVQTALPASTSASTPVSTPAPPPTRPPTDGRLPTTTHIPPPKLAPPPAPPSLPSVPAANIQRIPRTLASQGPIAPPQSGSSDILPKPSALAAASSTASTPTIAPALPLTPQPLAQTDRPSPAHTASSQAYVGHSQLAGQHVAIAPAPPTRKETVISSGQPPVPPPQQPRQLQPQPQPQSQSPLQRPQTQQAQAQPQLQSQSQAQPSQQQKSRLATTGEARPLLPAKTPAHLAPNTEPAASGPSTTAARPSFAQASTPAQPQHPSLLSAKSADARLEAGPDAQRSGHASLPTIAPAPTAAQLQAQAAAQNAASKVLPPVLATAGTASKEDSLPPKRPSAPERVARTSMPPSAASTPTPSSRQSSWAGFPHTPNQLGGSHFLPRGSGTRWKPNDPTPSTPGPEVGDMPSPAYEPLSPDPSGRAGARAEVTQASTSSSPQAHSRQQLQQQPRQPRTTVSGGRPRGRPPRNPKPALLLPEDERSTAGGNGQPIIKKEVSTPTMTLDMSEATAAEEDGAGSPRGEEGHFGRKRKRDESVDFPSPGRRQHSRAGRRRRLGGPPTPPTHVLWMRGFPKISASALDQISSHRHANMFAHRIRDRDAPGYDTIVRHAVDLKSIRMAISQGNKAATAAAAALPESEQALLQGASCVWLPIGEDLVPPRGIINSSQLECELVHMFANAVMYNPDSHRGPGPDFMVSETAEDDVGGMMDLGFGGGGGVGTGSGNPRYKVDEDGVVNDTRNMYIEVEKLLTEMRSAERQRGIPPPPRGARGIGVPPSLDNGKSSHRHDGDAGAATEDENDNVDDKPDTGAGDNIKDLETVRTRAASAATASADADEGSSATNKRRRYTRGQ